MTYVQGFLIPAKDKAGYTKMAADAAPIFLDHGARRIVETWAEDVPDGKRTDMKRAVALEDGEKVVFSWIVYDDKAAFDAAHSGIMDDDRMKNPPSEMPFDGKRMIFGGFEVVADTGEGGSFGHVTGMVAAVPDAKRAEHREHAEKTAQLFKARGATRVVNGWGVDVPEGKVTDFRRAVEAQPGTSVIFGWIEWPDKATAEAAMTALYENPEMRGTPVPWDGPTAIFGGFTPIFDTANA